MYVCIYIYIYILTILALMTNDKSNATNSSNRPSAPRKKGTVERGAGFVVTDWWRRMESLSQEKDPDKYRCLQPGRLHRSALRNRERLKGVGG